MSVEFWTNAERFYELWFAVISILILICGIAVLFMLIYARKGKKKRKILITLGIAGVLGVIGLVGHNRYQPYLEQAAHSNPLIRDREPTMTGYNFYGKYEENYYSQLNDLESLRNMVLYEEERVTEPVTYLGQGQFFHYFEQSDGDIFKQSRGIEFSEEAEQTQLVGSRFTLIDEEFQEIGFKNPKNIMFDYLEIPMSEQHKTYEPEYDPHIPSTEETFRQWNF